MILVDKALAQRLQNADPIRVGIIGAGYSGRTIAHQIIHSFPAIKLVAIANRTLEAARQAYASAGVTDIKTVSSAAELTAAARALQCCVTDDAGVVCDAEGIDAIIEATGTVEFGAGVVLRAIAGGKHVVLINCELDATLGPILKAKAEAAGLVYSNSDGDEPGVAMNQIRFVRSIGLQPVVAGNLKGFLDPYRNPDTQRAFAEKVKQKPETMACFADGTKLALELNVLANGTGFKVAKRGMHGPTLDHVNSSAEFFKDKLVEGGMVDFLVGAAPNNGAFVLGHCVDPVKAAFMGYLKMGPGPLYCFYTPFHLPQMEIPLTVARAVLFKDATVTPIGAPVADSLAVAKRDLKPGEMLDGFGGFTCYTVVDNYAAGRQENALPIGIAQDCRVKNPVPKDKVLTYGDVELPAGRVCDRLREEQNKFFKA